MLYFDQDIDQVELGLDEEGVLARANKDRRRIVEVQWLHFEALDSRRWANLYSRRRSYEMMRIDRTICD